MARFVLGPGAWLSVATSLLLTGPACAVTPDLSGVWLRDPPLHEPARSPAALFDEEPEYQSHAGAPELREPYATQYKQLQEKKRVAAERGQPLPDASTQCLPAGMPTLMQAILPLEIVQTHGKVIVIAEELGEIRRIYLKERMPALQDMVATYSGYSVGRWEGNALIVETRGVREDVLFWDLPHSIKMRVTERVRLLAPDRLEDRITIDDPEVLAKPYVFTFAYRKDPTYKVSEYICDNNRYRFDSEGGASLNTNPAQ